MPGACGCKKDKGGSPSFGATLKHLEHLLQQSHLSLQHWFTETEVRCHVLTHWHLTSHIFMCFQIILILLMFICSVFVVVVVAVVEDHQYFDCDLFNFFSFFF